MLNVDNPRLLRMKLHAQLFQDSEGSVHGGSRLCYRLTGDPPVVCIPRELISPASHLPINRRQKYVAQQGRDDGLNAKDNSGQAGVSDLVEVREAGETFRLDRDRHSVAGSNGGS